MIQKIISWIKNYYNLDVVKIQKITNKTLKVELSNNTIFIIKIINKKINKIYEYLKLSDVKNILYPKDYFVIDKTHFFIYQYIEEIYIPLNKKVLNLKDSLFILHQSTLIDKKLSSKEYKYLKRIYEKLDYKFKMLESFVRTSESKPIKEDFEWIVLSKYNIFLNCKDYMYQLQKKIHTSIDNKESVKYALNHGNPDITHIINNNFINFENSRLCIVVSDIAKFYVENSFININWKDTIKEMLIPYEGDFYKNYFKFLVLYIYMINLNINNTYSYETLNAYIRISEKIKIFINTFNNF